MGVIFDKILGEPLLHNHIKVQAIQPTVGANGDLYLNSTTNTLNLYYADEWRVLHTFSVSDSFLLLENGDFILLESGDKIILQPST